MSGTLESASLARQILTKCDLMTIWAGPISSALGTSQNKATKIVSSESQPSATTSPSPRCKASLTQMYLHPHLELRRRDHSSVAPLPQTIFKLRRRRVRLQPPSPKIRNPVYLREHRLQLQGWHFRGAVLACKGHPGHDPR